MECEFEEKEYEGPLNCEIGEKRKIYSPGQAFESIIGIDAAIYSVHDAFWGFLGLKRPSNWKSGVHLTPELWSFVKKNIDSSRFPKFKVNLFLQHKRPEYIKSHSTKEFSYWKIPCYRYKLKDKQQNILYRLEQRVAKKAIVTYACPCFHTHRELHEFTQRSKLVDNSNFAQPCNLQGHTRHTFVNGRLSGHAFSEPTETRGIDLLEDIDKALSGDISYENNSSFIISLAKDIEKVIEQSDAEFRESYHSFVQYIGLPEDELGYCLVKVQLFSYMANVRWHIVCQDHLLKHEA